MKTASLYTETVAILVAVTLAVHFLAAIDWPWAIVAGSVASVLLRTFHHRKTPVRP